MPQKQAPVQTQIGGQPVTPATPVTPPAPPTGSAPATPSTGGERASFGLRLVAALIDGFVVGAMYFGLFFLTAILVGLTSSGAEPGPFVGLLGFLPATAIWIYFTVMDVKFGATLGKKVLGLRVQNISTSENLTWIEAILRETIGRMLSGSFFAIGYLWMLWDENKQTWHDKIAKSVVVKV